MSLETQYKAIRDEIAKVIFGQDEVIEFALAALFSSGHILLEGPPGVAKTLLVRTIASALNLQYQRIQMTPNGGCPPGDFKSPASASSATPAIVGPGPNQVYRCDVGLAIGPPNFRVATGARGTRSPKRGGYRAHMDMDGQAPAVWASASSSTSKICSTVVA